MKSAFSRFFIIAVFFACGYSMIVATTPRFIGGRDPAAVRQMYDFSSLRGSTLDDAMKERVLAGLSVHKGDDHSVGLALGHFTLASVQGGEKTLACREYDKIVLTFEAEGVAVDGERPTMQVEGGCRFTDDLASTEPLMIPVEQILNEKPADGEFKFMQGHGVAVRFEHILDEWPRKWVLTDVKMQGLKGAFAVSRNEIHQQLGHFLQLTFDK